MEARHILLLAIVGGAAVWFVNHRSAPKPTAAPSAQVPAASKGFDCVRAAEAANGTLRDASMLAMRPPVDAGAWSSAEGTVSSAISSAESACSGGSEAETETKAALSLMRASLSDLSSAARGAGGAGDLARRQGEIDAHLDKARSLSR